MGWRELQRIHRQSQGRIGNYSKPTLYGSLELEGVEDDSFVKKKGPKNMNKRTMFMVGAVSAALLTSAGAVNATPTKNTIYVDGTKVNGAA